LNTKEEGRLTKSKKKRLNVFVACNNTTATVFVVVVCVCGCKCVDRTSLACMYKQGETLFIQLVIVEDALASFLSAVMDFFEKKRRKKKR
jgi:hypothetical protein